MTSASMVTMVTRKASMAVVARVLDVNAMTTSIQTQSEIVTSNNANIIILTIA